MGTSRTDNSISKLFLFMEFLFKLCISSFAGVPSAATSRRQIWLLRMLASSVIPKISYGFV